MKKFIPIFAGALLVTLGILVQSAMAQEDIGRLIKQLEEDSDRFSNSATKALDKSEYDGTAREDELIRHVRSFEDSIDRLKGGFEKGQDTIILAKEVQTKAVGIDKWLKKRSLGDQVSTDWGTVKSILLRLKATGKVKTS